MSRMVSTPEFIVACVNANKPAPNPPAAPAPGTSATSHCNTFAMTVL